MSTPDASIRTDVNFVSFAGQTGIIPSLDFTTVNSSQYATILKVSDGCHDISFSNLDMPSGNETAVDMDMTINGIIQGKFGGAIQPDNVLRFKGGCIDCKAIGTLRVRGKRNSVDVEVGDWMDQSYKMTKGLDLSGLTIHSDGGKNRVAIGWATPFSTKLGSNCQYLVIESLKLKLYWIAKWIVRKILRIPLGTKGPSWM